MSRLNKVITNSAVEFTEDEFANLTATFKPIVVACGGGGQGGGYVYTGDHAYIDINYNTDPPIIYLRQPVIDEIAKIADLETILSSNSADWNEVYQTVDENDEYWNDAYDTLSAHSGTWLVADDILSKQDKLSDAETAAIHDVSGKLAKSDLSFDLTVGGLISAVTLNNSKTAIQQPDISNLLTKASADTLYQPVRADYVTMEGVGANNKYAMTENGWTPIIDGGGDVSGMVAVIHDATLSGDGADTNSKLGLATSAAVNMTALSAASAVNAAVAVYTDENQHTFSYAIGSWMHTTDAYLAAGPDANERSIAKLYADYAGSAKWIDGNTTSVSAFSDIISELNNKLDAADLAGYLTTSAAANTYLTQSDASTTYLTKSDASTTYQAKGSYLTSVSTATGITGNGTAGSPLGFDTSYKVPSATSADAALSAADSMKAAALYDNTAGGQGTSSFNQISAAIAAKLDVTAAKSGTYGSVTAISAINNGTADIPIKDTNFWGITTTAATTAGNDNWQHYIESTNTFNYYKMIVHPSGTTADSSWANDGIIHIILEE